MMKHSNPTEIPALLKNEIDFQKEDHQRCDMMIHYINVKHFLCYSPVVIVCIFRWHRFS